MLLLFLMVLFMSRLHLLPSASACKTDFDGTTIVIKTETLASQLFNTLRNH